MIEKNLQQHSSSNTANTLKLKVRLKGKLHALPCLETITIINTYKNV